MAHRSSLLRRLARNRKGNVMYMTAGLLLPALATVGAGVDLGQAYMAKARLQQACDAGVLAGRREMADGGFNGQARQAAERMFEFNYPDDIYESRGVNFEASPSGASDISGRATATVDTIIMHMFGKDSFDLEVNCTARLEIANSDIMFVLDTTGSMNTVNSGDSVNRITALRTEVMAFYDTVASANNGGARIRYGFVPYSLTVNLRDVLEPGWLNNTVRIPSRTGQWVQTSSTGPSTNNPSWSNYSSWSNTGVIVSPANSSNCASQPRPSTSVTSGSPVPGSSTSGSNPRTITTTSTVTETETSFQNVWSSSACRQQRRTRTRNVVTTSSVTQQYRYTYDMITYDVAGAIGGGSLTAPSGPWNSPNVTTTWNGCIMERDTVAFDDNAAVPAGAYDLDIDLAPSNAATRWNVMLPALTHPRNSDPNNTSQSLTAVTTATDWTSYQTRGGDQDACPSPSRRLQEYPASQRSAMEAYVNALQPDGFTYHDIGMIWGARMLSPTGLFASSNNSAPNGMPISRHLIFMTDGQMNPEPGTYSFQGMEILMRRVGSNDDAELTRRHNARFLHACQQAKQRNITVWVVAFGTSLSTEMTNCASGGSAFQANNAAQLRQRFQQIAQQITRLRLQQ